MSADETPELPDLSGELVVPSVEYVFTYELSAKPMVTQDTMANRPVSVQRVTVSISALEDGTPHLNTVASGYLLTKKGDRAANSAWGWRYPPFAELAPYEEDAEARWHDLVRAAKVIDWAAQAGLLEGK